jgi:hypothetical protein
MFDFLALDVGARAGAEPPTFRFSAAFQAQFVGRGLSLTFA